MASILLFGAGTTQTWGVVQSVSEDQSAEVAEARDENGKVIEQKAYSVSMEKKFEALVKSAGTLPDIGTVVTVDAWSGLLTSISVTKENTNFRKVSVTAKKSDAAELTPYSAS